MFCIRNLTRGTAISPGIDKPYYYWTLGGVPWPKWVAETEQEAFRLWLALEVSKALCSVEGIITAYPMPYRQRIIFGLVVSDSQLQADWYKQINTILLRFVFMSIVNRQN